ncbi:hypothetical protein CK203_027573 [Vitis vinifera]|uniref:Uncharacterized protein n=1 Tax=Vitis vinifera TaxID=29760 RepID=A0A438JBA0_VITVI|nr:hypothetical protein CK203_027573 [Vitis vinifera]
MKQDKGHREEEEEEEEEELSMKKEGPPTKKDGKNHEKANAMRSKHSVTEQRRRSKINERMFIKWCIGAAEGSSFGGNPKACGFWDPVIERISRRLDEWKKTYLSFGNRITLIKSCLTHMPCYFLSLFKIPASVNHLSRLAELLDCKAFGWPILYQGLPLGGNPKACGFWDPVIERISRRLDEWKKTYLSFGNRITLIKSCLTHMPCYFLSLFKIPASVNHLSRLAELLDCKAFGWPILYQGLPLGGNPKACGFWDPVIERISRRLDEWKKTYLSFGNRITLIKSCLTHMPCYFLSLFKIPASVVAKIERLQRDFLWSGVGEDFSKESHSLREMVVESDGHIIVLGRLLHKSFRSFPSLLEDLEGLMRSLDGLHFSPSVFPTKFVWNSQVPFKVKSFVWLVAHKKMIPSSFLARVEELQTHKFILLVFGQISGLKVNLDKSNLYGINLDQDHFSRLALLFYCKVSDWPLLYLGLLLGGNSKARGFWDPVIERILWRLDGWKKVYLSFGGKRGIGVWEDFSKESRSFREMVVESDGHIVALQVFQDFSKYTWLVVGMGKEFAFGKTCGGGTNLWDSNIQDYLE